MRWSTLAFFGALLILAAAPALGPIAFEEIADRAGIHFIADNCPTPNKNLPETMLAGVALFDYDNDGYLDIYFVNGAAIPSLKKESPKYWNRLFHNNHDGTFTDVTEKAGVKGEGSSLVSTARRLLPEAQHGFIRVAAKGFGKHPADPAELDGRGALGAEGEARGFLAFEDQLRFHIEIVAAEEVRKGFEGFMSAAAGQKVLILTERQGAEADAHDGLLIPDLVAEYDTDAELFGARVALGEAGAEAGIERAPGAGEGLNLDGDFEIVREHLAEGRSGARVLGEQALVANESLIGDGLVVLQAASAQADEGEHVSGEGVGAGALIGNREAVFFPGAVEQRNHAVVEEVEEVLEGRIVGVEALDEQLGVAGGEDAEGPGEAEEADGHFERAARIVLEGLDFSGREAEGRAHADAHGLTRGLIEGTDGMLDLGEPLQQADGLKEREIPRMRAEPFGQRFQVQRRIRFPALGAHSLSNSFL